MKKNIKSNTKYALEVKGYTKRFGRFLAVNDASFGVGHGKIHGFIGPNGAGKTTTIKAIIGAFSKTKGQIYIEGFKAGTVKAKKRIGYIPERASFPPELNCIEYLIAMAQLSGFGYLEAKKKANTILKDLDLLKHKFRKPNNFSSGMKKKILVAQALILDPSVLVLDEPAANLDPTARKEMLSMFKKVAKTGTSVFLSSHILSELQDIIEEVTFITQGTIRYSGKVKDLASDEGLIIGFVDSDLKESKAFIKKHKGVETTTGWKFETKSVAKTNALVKEIMSKKIKVNSILFLKSNLSAAYDRLVEDYGRESGVDKNAIKKKNQKKNAKNKVKNIKNKSTKKGGK